ncbi:MAG: hypothetical protein A3G99_02715 [Candidatus Zambryskibacteria bacterium RIFCSPLOWO2_12_FULL_39_23]|uniref:Uncharacterized protein n=1 Tax=Candidatus Zambryskibacteria bacterium RIFCSPLOWO2_12_FULL_39_23 TaxID=1802776 RepID=A0A1G2URF8_9BACT|nr:MAG: hypothetical protein A2W51_01215 [Candidatus Zambryskibacteria bacterium RIFCSPHIGHO2_02_39_10]OHB11971.1 MAG: hypothetical protein A3G99_02715 [Candidatus Zambryskibacteria bacterium RIFCSPLOWO2_12_FULL_39_23]
MLEYSKQDGLVFLEITGISEELLPELRELLRMNMIAPVVKGIEGRKGNGSPDAGQAYYSAVFGQDNAREIEEWLRSRGVVPKS